MKISRVNQNASEEAKIMETGCLHIVSVTNSIHVREGKRHLWEYGPSLCWGTTQAPVAAQAVPSTFSSTLMAQGRGEQGLNTFF